MKFVVAALLIVAAPSAFAQATPPWTKVFESPESTIYLVNDPMATKAPDSARVWFLADRKIALHMSLLNLSTYSSLIQRWELDCRTRAYRVTGGAYYADQMGQGKELRLVPPRDGYEIAPVNPQMNAIFNAACAPHGLKSLTTAQRESLPRPQ